MKVCSKCGELKPLDEFGLRNDRPCGYRSACKDCIDKQRVARGRTKEGVIKTIFATQKRTSKERGMPQPSYDLAWLTEWCLGQDAYHELYTYWVKHGYQRDDKPSVDRLDDYVSYTPDNIRIITCRENYVKGAKDCETGLNRKALEAVRSIDKEGNVTEYFSIAEANRVLGKPRYSSDIVAVLNGRQKTAFGFKWERI